MTMNFPSPAVPGQIYASPSGPVYRFDDPVWTVLEAGPIGVDSSSAIVTSSGTPVLAKTLADWMEDVCNAPQSFTGNSIQALRLTQDVDHRVEIIKDDAGPLNWQNTRAGIVYQHRDTLPLAQQKTADSVVFSNVYTGNGYVTPAADSSESIWTGVHSAFKKYGNGSGHAFTTTGELYANGDNDGITGYNEGGLYQGIMSNVGSKHGTIGGVEVQIKDGVSGVSGTDNFDTKMNAIIGRIARWNNGTRLVAPFMASSEGAYPPDAVFLINPTGSQPFKNGIDMRDGTFTQYPFISNGFTVNAVGDINAKSLTSPTGAVISGAASGLAADPGYAVIAHGQTWAMRGALAGGSLFFQNNTAGTIPFVFGTTGVLTATGAAILLSGTAPPAGGVVALRLSSTSAFGIFVGSGAPAASAAKGSLYLRTDGTTTNDRMYVNTNGTTGWAALTSAS